MKRRREHYERRREPARADRASGSLTRHESTDSYNSVVTVTVPVLTTLCQPDLHYVDFSVYSAPFIPSVSKACRFRVQITRRHNCDWLPPLHGRPSLVIIAVTITWQASPAFREWYDSYPTLKWIWVPYIQVHSPHAHVFTIAGLRCVKIWTGI